MHYIIGILIVLVGCAISPVISYACTPLTDSAIGGFNGEVIVFNDGTIPTNFRILHASTRSNTHEQSQWSVLQDGELINLDFEAEQTYEYGSGINGKATVWRPTQELTAGEQIESCSGCSRLTLTSPDITPPAPPVLSFERYRPSEPTDDCSPENLGILYLNAKISNTSEQTLVGMLYLGDTAESAKTSTRISHMRRVIRSQKDFRVELFLHSEGLASPTRPFCVALELEDSAGNRGERSEPLCLATLESTPVESDEAMLDEDDQLEPSCSVTTSPSQPSGDIWFLLPLFGLLHRRRQRLAIL